ncbi:MAG: hypothetical protein UY90_C0019G0002 [Candidatus Peregrinibacteria bacterium GW2011_GWA2_54_9]|nr:MAG: hypothetical protein UY90_C0019G0002 [Candidatus Peregrinibacteria bacterium GW2011_GWA2_54_9]
MVPVPKTQRLGWQLSLLVLYVLLIPFVWLLPALLAGQGFDVMPLLPVRNFADTGLFSLTDDLGRYLNAALLPSLGVTSTMDGRLSTVLLAQFARFIPWSDLVGWTAVASAILAVSLIPWWFSVLKLSSPATAWCSTVLLSFLPLFWRQAVWTDFYAFAFFFLFLSIALYLWIRGHSEKLALVLAGLSFGACVASRDAFLIFLPWISLGYVLFRLPNWKKALGGIFLFLFCTGVVYILPYTGDIRSQGYPTNHNLALLWPGEQNIQEGFYLHLYPDPYTYLFNRAAYDESLVAAYADMSFLEKLQQQKIFINFDVGSPSFGMKVLNGFWLFAGSIPPFFQLQTLGGLAFWLFVLPGTAVLWKRNRNMLLFLLGLIFFSEFLMRFVMHYARDHTMDYGWMFAFFAAVGVVAVAKSLHEQLRLSSRTVAIILMTVMLSVHLIQVNRVLFGQRYRRSTVPEVMAMAEGVNTLGENAVVALAMGGVRVEQLAQLTDAVLVPFHPTTVARLVQQGSLRDVFTRYGITHVLGYEGAQVAQMRQQDPLLREVPVPPPLPRVSSSNLQVFLLHLIR